MLYDLAHPHAEQFALFNLFRYITFRSGAACLTAFVISLAIGPAVIARSSAASSATASRSGRWGPERHLVEKAGTPTMGGVLILSAWLLSTLLWADLFERLRLGGVAGDAGVRRGGLRRRLPEAVAAQHAAACRSASGSVPSSPRPWSPAGGSTA